MSHLLYFLSRSSAAKTTVIAVLSGALEAGSRRQEAEGRRQKFFYARILNFVSAAIRRVRERYFELICLPISHASHIPQTPYSPLPTPD
ncbi:MAG: hypothetical protein RMY28_010025 [Nostoc sp. ChiSLP01]